MEGIHSVKKLLPSSKRYWSLENGFCNTRILLLVPTNSDGCLLHYPKRKEGPENHPTGRNELPFLLDGIGMALFITSAFDLQ